MEYKDIYRTFFSRVHTTHLLGGVALLVLVVVGVWYGFPNSPEEVRETREPQTYTLVRAETVPLPIEGVRVAKDDVVVSAQTAGSITSVPVREGDAVAKGDVLALVGQPVLAAQRDALLARIRTVEAERARADVAVEGERETTLARVVAGRDTGDASVSLAETEYERAREALVATLSRTYLSAIEALTFLADTSGLSSLEGVALRTEVARMLGGTQRSAYLGESIRGGGSVEGIADAIARAGANPRAVGDAELATLTDTMHRALPTLGSAFDAAERAVYERGSAISPLTRTQYTTYRTAVRDAQSALEGAGGAYERALRARAVARATAEGSLAVSEVEGRYTAEVANREGVVTDATRTELAAQLRALDATLTEAVVRAPYDGIVTRVHVDVGGYVAPGTPIARVQGVRGFEVHATVPVRYRAGLALGASVMFARGETGVLDRVASQVDERSGGVPVYFTLLEGGKEYTAGEWVRGELSLVPESTTSVFALPHAYVSFDFSGPVVRTDAGTARVMVVQDTREYLYVTGEDLHEGAIAIR